MSDEQIETGSFAEVGQEIEDRLIALEEAVAELRKLVLGQGY